VGIDEAEGSVVVVKRAADCALVAVDVAEASRTVARLHARDGRSVFRQTENE